MYSPPQRTGKFDQSLWRLPIFPTTNVVGGEIIPAKKPSFEKKCIGGLA
jgi:hypothetical protein